MNQIPRNRVHPHCKRKTIHIPDEIDRCIIGALKTPLYLEQVITTKFNYFLKKCFFSIY